MPTWGRPWLAQEYLMYHFWTPLTGLVAVGARNGGGSGVGVDDPEFGGGVVR